MTLYVGDTPVTVPLKIPLASANLPVPPVMVLVSATIVTPFASGALTIPMLFMNILSPLAAVSVMVALAKTGLVKTSIVTLAS